MTAAPPAIKLSPASQTTLLRQTANPVSRTAPAATPKPATPQTIRSQPNRTTLLPTTHFVLTAPPLATKLLHAKPAIRLVLIKNHAKPYRPEPAPQLTIP